MEWACLHDQYRLSRQEDKLCCAQCGRYYEVSGGIPIFAHNDHGKEIANRRPPVLQELWELMQYNSSDEAAREFCERHECARNRRSAHWKFLISVPKDSEVLEIGGGFGDDSIDLGGRARTTISTVPNLINASIVYKHVHENELTNVEVAVIQDITHLPFADKSIAAIAMEDAANPGFNVTNRNFSFVAAEWRRILSPGGTVFLGLSNPYDQVLGLRLFRTKLQVRGHPESLNRFLKRLTTTSRCNSLGLRQTIRFMIREGFHKPIIYAPFPDENETEVVIPIEDDRLIRYFLSNLIKRNSLMVRMAITVANVSVSLHLFRYLVPYYFLIFELDRNYERIC